MFGASEKQNVTVLYLSATLRLREDFLFLNSAGVRPNDSFVSPFSARPRSNQIYSTNNSSFSRPHSGKGDDHASFVSCTLNTEEALRCLFGIFQLKARLYDACF
jgi:hypothetical protein